MIAAIESALARIPGPRPPYQALIATGPTRSRFERRCVTLSTLSATSSAKAVTTTATPYRRAVVRLRAMSPRSRLSPFMENRTMVQSLLV
jgi:hypothetical protein